MTIQNIFSAEKIDANLIEAKNNNKALMNGRTVDKIKAVGQKIGVGTLAAVAALITILTFPLFLAVVSISIVKDVIARTPGIRVADNQEISEKSWFRATAPAAFFLPSVTYSLIKFLK
jgi:hypothetical protein